MVNIKEGTIKIPNKSKICNTFVNTYLLLSCSFLEKYTLNISYFPFYLGAFYGAAKGNFNKILLYHTVCMLLYLILDSLKRQPVFYGETEYSLISFSI